MIGYCTQASIENIFGALNVAKWSNLDGQADSTAGPNGTPTPDTNRINLAICYATTLINDRLRDGPYVIPLMPNGGPLIMVTDVCARLAGVWLYESRGLQDKNEVTGEYMNPVGGHKKYALAQIDRWKARKDHLPAAFNRMYTNIPSLRR